MSHSSATCYADRALQRTVRIVENVSLARDTFRVRLECAEIARRIVPGQFLMLRMAGLNDPLLGRPLALYDTVVDAAGEPVGIDVVYLVLGKFTRLLSQAPVGTLLEVWGPLGNGFTPKPSEHLLMVAGGIGQTPFMALGREALGLRHYGAAQAAHSSTADRLPAAREDVRPRHIVLCYGARTADYLAGVDDFAALGIDVQVSTDDGTAGHHGLVTDLVRRQLDQHGGQHCRIVCCGPEPMMHAVAQLAAEYGTPCEVSLETPMACGIGICFSCVAKVRQADGTWDYRRTCVEGPVFDAQAIEF